MRALRNCLKDPIPPIFEAADLLRRAVDSHLAGEASTAGELFRAADMPEVRAWTESIWGSGWKDLVKPRSIDGAPPHLSKEQRQPLRMPNKQGEATIIARDGYHCRFCGIPVIHKRIRERAKRLYPQSVTWGSTNQSQHAGFQAMWLQFDHLVPHSRGGTSELSNVLITCAPCNYGRFHYLVEELDLINPFDRQPVTTDWNGLEDLI